MPVGDAASAAALHRVVRRSHAPAARREPCAGRSSEGAPPAAHTLRFGPGPLAFSPRLTYESRTSSRSFTSSSSRRPAGSFASPMPISESTPCMVWPRRYKTIGVKSAGATPGNTSFVSTKGLCAAPSQLPISRATALRAGKETPPFTIALPGERRSQRARPQDLLRGSRS